MNLIRIYGLFLRHFYLITRSFPRILDLIYWPTIQITLWGFISNFFATYFSTNGSTFAKVPMAPEIAQVEISLSAFSKRFLFLLNSE